MSLNLFCAVFPSEHLFSVSIDANKTVDALKKAIKLEKKPRLNDIAADELTVYKVLIPDDDGLAPALDNLRLDDHAAAIKLRATQKLSIIFSNGVEDGHLHILVQLPGACYIASDLFHFLCIYYQMLVSGQTLLSALQINPLQRKLA